MVENLPIKYLSNIYYDNHPQVKMASLAGEQFILFFFTNLLCR